VPATNRPQMISNIHDVKLLLSQSVSVDLLQFISSTDDKLDEVT